MALARLQSLRRLHRLFQPQRLLSFSQSSPIYLNTGAGGSTHRSIVTCSCKIHSILGQNTSGSALLRSMNVNISELTIHSNGTRSMSTMKVPVGARQVALKVTMHSPGFVYEPYKPREPIPFWRRWFTPSGWRRTKEDVILEMKSAYAINRLRKKTGYSKKLFYQHAVRLYKEINILMAKGDTSALRKAVTAKMYSVLKNEIKKRESMWTSVYWELILPVASIRTLRARMIGLDKDDLDKAFIQLTIEFISKQRFEAYDSKGVVLSGDKTKEVLVRDIWVFERSLFHPGAEWLLCARLSI